MSKDLDDKPFGTYAPNALQRAVIAAAHGSGLKRGAFRPWLSRLVNLLGSGPIDATYQGASVPAASSGQRHRARRAVQSRLQFAGTGLSPRTCALRRHLCRCRRQCRHLCRGAGKACRRTRARHCNRAASGEQCAARLQCERLKADQSHPGQGRRGRHRRRTDDRNRRRQSRRQSHLRHRRHQGAGASPADDPARRQCDASRCSQDRRRRL